MEKLTFEKCGEILVKNGDGEYFRNTITEKSDTIDWLNMIARQPTAYDVDWVLGRINSIGKSYCTSIKCDENCQDCEHGCIMRAITPKVKVGGVNE